MTTLTIKDESMTGVVQNTIELNFSTELVTVKDIIESRVAAEVKKYNATLGEYFSGLVQPTEAERTLNGYKMRERKQIDAEKQTYVALKAFKENSFFVLIDDKQVENLDETFKASDLLSVSFVKLTALVGGWDVRY